MKPNATIFGLLILAVTMPTAAQHLDVASYDIEVVLDPDTHELKGSQSVRWRNTTSAATSELWFHLYLNAFAGSDSSFMRELAADSMGESFVIHENWGWTRITRLALPDGTDLLPGLTFERPDDDNGGDFTVARVPLPLEVLPGAAVELVVDFEARLPRVVARTGYAGDFHMVAQWFPKLGVFQGEAGWNCHQFHVSTEFFADFGSYRVRMTVPRGWVVGATGELVSREPEGTGDVLEFIAPAVHDFAWATAPPSLMSVVETDFEPGRDVPLVWLERAGDQLDLGAADLELPPMIIRLLVPKSQEQLAARMIEATRLAVAWMGLHFGPCPHPILTVVSPPPGADAAGGMEYPTLFTTGAARLDLYPPFSWRSGIEEVTAHEFAHQYFQGLLASNEFEQAWLDEGLTSWATARCVDDMVRDRLVPGIKLARTWGYERFWLNFESLPVTIDRPNWERRRLIDVRFGSYGKPALAIRTLEGLYGEDRVLRAVRQYVADHRYGHPTGADLRASLERSLGEDLGWFFDAVISGDQDVDWAVTSVRHREIKRSEGMLWRDGDWAELDHGDGVESGGEGPWEVTVEIVRRGELRGPVEVALEWADGRSERRRWDGNDRWMRWTEESAQRLRQVVVDPDGVWMLENRRADNYWRSQADGQSRMWWFEGVLTAVRLLTVPWS